MREIKFRAWNKTKCMMFYPFNEIMVDIDESHVCLCLIQGLIPHDIKYRDDDFILMQYTDRKDKNDVEIYEGDVVLAAVQLDEDYALGYDIKIQVIWDYCSFRGKIIEKPRCHIANYSDLIDIDDLKVIGNIYENRELLNNCCKKLRKNVPD